MKQTEFIRRSTADQILKALIRGKLSRHVVYAYRKRHPNDDAGIEKTGFALEQYRVYLLDQKRQPPKPAAATLALAELLDQYHPHTNVRSSMTKDMVERQKQLIKLSFGRDISTEQVFTLWAASNMNIYSELSPQGGNLTHRGNNSQPRDEGM